LTEGDQEIRISGSGNQDMRRLGKYQNTALRLPDSPILPSPNPNILMTGFPL
jgi:hypothetical protein